MEHRCSERYVSDLTIQIYQHELPVAEGRIKNASLKGVFIETEFAGIDCEHQILLEILHSTRSAKSQQIKIAALIAHKRSNGFGAELDIIDSEHADYLSELFLGHKIYSKTTQKLKKTVRR